MPNVTLVSSALTPCLATVTLLLFGADLSSAKTAGQLRGMKGAEGVVGVDWFFEANHVA